MFRVSYLMSSSAALALGLVLPQAARAQALTAISAPGGPPVKPVTTSSIPAAAATDQVKSTGLADIVVTAQKRSENLQNVPIAVTAFSAETLATKGIEGVVALATTVPGLSYTSQANQASPRIRGVGTAIAGSGNENAVSTYVDGVYYGSAAASILSFNNISQIAVLKGPQGTLFGRNATGGLIQITTRNPSETFGGMASATYANHNTLGGDLYVTGGSHGIAVDFAVHYRNQVDGFGTNLFNGHDVNKSQELAIRSKIRAKLGALTTATLTLDYENSRSLTPAYRAVDGAILFGGARFSGGKFDVNSNFDPLARDTQYGAALNLTHSFGDGPKLVSITAFRDNKFNVGFDSDAQAKDLISAQVREPESQFSQELQLISPDGGRFKWVLGAYYFHFKGGFGPGVVRLPIFGLVTTINTVQTANSYAGFAQGTYKLTDDTSFTAGIRMTSERKTVVGSGSLFLLGPRITVPQGPYTDSINVTKPTWRVALDHKLSPSTLVYASYNRGFKSGGFDPGNSARSVSFKPEVLDAFEVGLKTQFFDRKVRINGALFYYDYKNIQLNTFVNGLLSIYNGRSAKIYGLDFDVTAAPTDRLTLTGGLSLLHDRFGDFPITVTAPGPTGGTIRLPDANARGKRLQNTPDWQLNLGAQYEIPLRSGNVLLAADFFHSGRWFNTPENRLQQKAYNLVNASVTWRIGDDENYSLKAWGRNLGNVAYADQITVSVPAGDFLTVAPGRTFGVTLGAKF